MKEHIQYLLRAEKLYADVSFHWDRRDDNTLTITTVGYKHMAHSEIEEALLKLGCRYDFEQLQHFDKMSGRTFTRIKEPAVESEEEENLCEETGHDFDVNEGGYCLNPGCEENGYEQGE
jgi:hypothetical protein